MTTLTVERIEPPLDRYTARYQNFVLVVSAV